MKKTNSYRAGSRYTRLVHTAADESGVAMVMVLAVMSLLLVLTLSFAISATHSMRSVQAAKDLVQSRLHNETGIENVFEFLEKEFSGLDDDTNLFPATKAGVDERHGPSTWDNRYYWLSAHDSASQNRDVIGLDTSLHIAMNGVPVTAESGLAGAIVADDADNGWIHVSDAVDGESLVARISYIVFDESGKLDPTRCIGDTAEGSEFRDGLDPSEISLMDALDDSSLAARFQRTAVDPAAGLLPENAAWFSYYNVFKSFHYHDSEIWNSDPAKAEAVLADLFPFSYDIEAYSVIEPETGSPLDKHRFNLARDDWDDLTVDVVASDAGAFDAGPNAGGISWLANAADPEQGRQIAANLIDYSDDDTGEPVHATSDYDVANPDVRPTYCGNENVPYLNEFQFRVDINGGNVDIRLNAAELVNMYAVDPAEPFVDSVLKVRAQIDSAEISGLILDFEKAITAADSITLADPDYHYVNTIAPQQSLPNVPEQTLTDLTVTVISARLTDGATGLLKDFAFDEDLASGADTLDGSGGLATRYVSVECNDPRNNLDSAEWTWSPWGDAPGDAGSVVQIGLPRIPNTVFAIGADPTENDSEPLATQPWEVSTAYIRNAPMESLWELGAIHRGASWQTLNVRDFAPILYAASATAGLGAFGGVSGGDAFILSQVKLTSDTEVTGRVNVNTQNAHTLRGLFARIQLGSAYDDLSAGTPITAAALAADNSIADIIGTTGPVGPSTAAPPIAGTIRAVNGSGVDGAGLAVGEPFRYRGQIASVDRLSNGTVGVQDTDRLQEEIICKVVNLTTTRSNFFTVYLTSQIINDLETGYHGGTRGVYDEGVDTIQAEQRLLAVLYRDAMNNRFRVVRYEFLDD